MSQWITKLAFLFTALAGGAAFGQLNTSIVNSPHNLSAGGTSTIRAVSEGQICIFCHTPHNAAPVQPLWNRNVPVSAYTVYSSNSLQAQPNQPTGASKLCLSCHDGTIAIGSVLSRAEPIALTGGVTTIPQGATNLGTNLSGTHPISFRYDATLSTRDPKIKDPSALPPAVKLDRQMEMQCTSCHDAHDDSRGKFLVMDNSNSQLCNSCHRLGTTEVVGHQQCASCHQPHNSPSGPYLLVKQTVSDSCQNCHGGQAGTTAPNIAPDLLKISKHDTGTPVNLPNPLPNNVTCADCHEPHTMRKIGATVPMVSGRLGAIDGVNATGAAQPAASYQYEVCFKCHNDLSAVRPYISRQIVQENTRLEFAPSSVSFHPVEAAGRNTFVPSLRPGLTVASLIYCTDCHSSDTGKDAGGAGPNGPHGSNFRPLLKARYDTMDRTSESSNAYALCYGCHDRTSILNDRSFTKHHEHIVDQRTPCSVCHDSHGISSVQGTMTKNSHLINFDTTVVRPDSTGRLEYNTTGVGHGRCYLNCHGVNHSPFSY